MVSEKKLNEISALMRSNQFGEALPVVFETMLSNPEDGLLNVLLGDIYKALGEQDGARKQYIDAFCKEYQCARRVAILSLSTLKIAESEMERTRPHSALKALKQGYFAAGGGVNVHVCNLALQASFDAFGIAAVDPAGRNLLVLLRGDESSSMAEKARIAAYIYAKMASLQVVETQNGRFKNLDQTVAGIQRLRRYCGIVWSYYSMTYGDKRGELDDLEDFDLIRATLIPWRVAHGRSDGRPVDADPVCMIEELSTKGMFGLSESVEEPPEAPWNYNLKTN